MEFRIAHTFRDSLARLANEEQKAAKTTAFDLQVNPEAHGLRLHRLDGAKDKNFWSARVSGDLRIILHQGESTMLLCYVDHHEEAYRWAERRKIERHPTTGAAQIVEVRERVLEIEVPRLVEVEAPPVPRPRVFAALKDEDLLAYGVPPEWLGDVRHATEDSLLGLVEHLPAEAAEALLELATGGRPQPPVRVGEEADPFAHPDAQRRFLVVADSEDLQRALEFPWEQWTVFLHPAQRDLVRRHYQGPARVCGSAGTGKTVVALHRAVHLARAHPEAKVLLTTFSDTLAAALRVKLGRLVGAEPAVHGRIHVDALDRVGLQVYEAAFGPARLASHSQVQHLLSRASAAMPAQSFSQRFLEVEWCEVVDAWQLEDWDSYREVPRLGRKTRLSERQRQGLWALFERVRQGLEDEGLLTVPGALSRATRKLQEGAGRPWDFAVVDESQDLGVPQLRFLAALVGNRPDGLFFAGDLGQRIFQTPFSWKALGVDVRGRSSNLRINYRTSHQIRRQADRLLPATLADVDGVQEGRKGTVSVFSGPEPEVRVLDTGEEEGATVAAWLRARRAEGMHPEEMGLFVRSEDQLHRARAAVRAAGLEPALLDGSSDGRAGCLAVCTMHLAKGLEFRAVAVMGCDEEVLPLQSRVEAVADQGDLQEVYDTERHLLYVACTRAREHLLVTGVDPASEFLDDLAAGAR